MCFFFSFSKEVVPSFCFGRSMKKRAAIRSTAPFVSIRQRQQQAEFAPGFDPLFFPLFPFSFPFFLFAICSVQQ